MLYIEDKNEVEKFIKELNKINELAKHIPNHAENGYIIQGMYLLVDDRQLSPIVKIDTNGLFNTIDKPFMINIDKLSEFIKLYKDRDMKITIDNGNFLIETKNSEVYYNSNIREHSLSDAKSSFLRYRHILDILKEKKCREYDFMSVLPEYLKNQHSSIYFSDNEINFNNGNIEFKILKKYLSKTISNSKKCKFTIYDLDNDIYIIKYESTNTKIKTEQYFKIINL